MRTLGILQEHYPHVADMGAVMGRVEAEFRRRATTDGLPLKYFARELLEFLTAKGEKIALATSTVTDIAIEELKNANLFQSYTAEYRRDAVALAQEIGASRAARQLGIPADTLYTWISRAKQGSLPQSPIPAQPKESLQLAEQLKLAEQENRALKAENAQLRKEREILEGATAFFASRQKK